MSKKKSTFEQVMKAKQSYNRAKQAMYRAEEKYDNLVDKFPECHNQLFTYEDKLYVVSNHKNLWNDKKIIINEVTTGEI